MRVTGHTFAAAAFTGSGARVGTSANFGKNVPLGVLDSSFLIEAFFMVFGLVFFVSSLRLQDLSVFLYLSVDLPYLCHPFFPRKLTRPLIERYDVDDCSFIFFLTPGRRRLLVSVPILD